MISDEYPLFSYSFDINIPYIHKIELNFIF